jgi:hypothetical protein
MAGLALLVTILDYVVPEYSNIGKKLVESLAHETIVQDASAKEVFPHIHPKTLDDSLKEARAESKNDYHPLWDRDFLKKLLSDKILTQAGLFSPEVLQHFEKVLKLYIDKTLRDRKNNRNRFNTLLKMDLKTGDPKIKICLLL